MDRENERLLIERLKLSEQYNIEDLVHIGEELEHLLVRYRCVAKKIQTKMEVLNDELSIKTNRNPISSIKARIKKPSSILEKLKRQGNELSIDSIRENLNDVAGIRVICSFVDDIYAVADMLSNQDDIRVLRIKDYIKNPKEGGYRSYHMIVESPVYFSEEKTWMKAEIQIRTIAMDFWASLEHHIRYKKDIVKTDGITERLKSCADQISALDEEMMSIRREMYPED